MRIIFLESIHNYGGASKSTLEIAQRLIDVGHQVCVVDFWGSCQSYVDDCFLKNIPLKILDKREKPILLKDKGKMNTVINYAKFLMTKWVYKNRMSKIIADFNPQLISVNNTKTLSILSSSKSYRIAYFARGWFLPNTFNLLTKQLLKKRVDVFLTVSEATRHMVYASGFAELNDIYVIQNAINPQKLRNKINPKDWVLSWDKNNGRCFNIMHCGTFIKTKGQHISVEVLKRLVDKKINVKLILVGLISSAESSKNYFDHIRNLVKEYELSDHVEFVINKSDILTYYSKIDLLMHPSYSEGLPRVVLEAMAFGKPVIGNAVGGMIDIISNNYTGFLTNFNAIDEYVDYAEMLINDKVKYKFISENAYGLIKSNYTEKNQIQAFKKIDV